MCQIGPGEPMKTPTIRCASLAVLVVLGIADCSLASAGASATPSRQRLPSLQTGDLVFQASRGRLAKVIRAATRSKFTHVGFVVMRKGKPLVLEANGPVKITRLDRFIRRGVGRKVVIKRVRGGLSRVQKQRLVRAGRKHLRVRYDPTFRWTDTRMYCSELVWKAYHRGIGMALANRELMQSLRERGKITGGPRPFAKSDQSRFLNKLETAVAEAKHIHP